MGRLDIVSFALVIVGLGVVFFVLFGLVAVKEDAVASSTAAAKAMIKEEVEAQVQHTIENVVEERQEVFGISDSLEHIEQSDLENL